MKTYLTIGLLAVCCACSQPDCPNMNDDDMHARQTELLNQIQNSTAPVAYYFERSEGNYLIVNCYGENFCGRLQVLVPNTDTHADKLLQQGGYRGAELSGLRLHAENLGGQPMAVYDSMEKIID